MHAATAQAVTTQAPSAQAVKTQTPALQAVEKQPFKLHLLKSQSSQKQTTVLKIGGSILERNLDSLADNLESLAKQVAFLVADGVKLIIVHGGGPHISAELKKQGIEPKFIDGLRVTDEATLDVALCTLDKVNQAIVQALQNVGVNAVGFCSEDPLFLSKKASMVTGVDLGWVGEIESVDLAQLDATVYDVAVVAPIGYSDGSQIYGDNQQSSGDSHISYGHDSSSSIPDSHNSGDTADSYDCVSFCQVTSLYNLNADHAAMGIAKALKAESLVFLSDVPGVLSDCNDKSSCIDHIKPVQVEQLIADGVIQGGMIQKIRNSAAALHAGVGRVCIADGRIEGAVIDTALKRLRSGTTIGP